MDRLSSSDGSIEVEILPEFGARLHRLRAFGHDLLRTPRAAAEHERDGFFWGAYVMAPWCGRTASGTVHVAGRDVTLDANFPDGTAIHGQVHGRPWDRLEEGRYRVLGGGAGWPWPYAVELSVDLRDRLLRLGLGLTNRSNERMPAGLGLHPWFLRPVEVAFPASAVYPSNTASPPEPEPVVGDYDLRRLKPMPADLDASWTQLDNAPVVLQWPEAGVRATVRASAPSLVVVAASPGEIDAVAVEPQTHAPQGLRRLLLGEPDAMTLVEPGASLTLGIEMSFQPVP
ncbi:MAG: aldose 1-epimerase [Chloroflexota bacterium]